MQLVNKILYVDFLGVLDEKGTSTVLDNDKVYHLNRIAKAVPRLEFGYATSLRKHTTTPHLERILKNANFDHIARFVHKMAMLNGFDKSDEFSESALDHPRPAMVALLDDEESSYKAHKPPRGLSTKFFLVDHKMGLTESVADQIIAYFNGEES